MDQFGECWGRGKIITGELPRPAFKHVTLKCLVESTDLRNDVKEKEKAFGKRLDAEKKRHIENQFQAWCVGNGLVMLFLSYKYLCDIIFFCFLQLLVWLSISHSR